MLSYKNCLAQQCEFKKYTKDLSISKGNCYSHADNFMLPERYFFRNSSCIRISIRRHIPTRLKYDISII